MGGAVGEDVAVAAGWAVNAAAGTSVDVGKTMGVGVEALDGTAILAGDEVQAASNTIAKTKVRVMRERFRPFLI